MKKINFLIKSILICSFPACLFIAFNSGAQTVPAYVPTAGLAAWYPLNGNANDESGNGNNGTPNGVILTTDRFGIANQAYYFNGNNEHISAQTDEQLPQSNSFSISVWMSVENRPEGWQENAIVGNLGVPGFGAGFQIEVDNPPSLCNGGYRTSDNQSKFSYGTDTILASQWYNYIFVAAYDSLSDSTNTFKYINGALDNIVKLEGHVSYNNISSLYIGTNIDGFIGQQRAFKGKIDDIGIWDRALTEQEISQLYHSCVAPLISLSPLGDTSVCKPSTVMLTSVVTGTAVTYQWKKNGEAINGATQATYEATESGKYKCKVTNDCGSATSSFIEVTINSKPKAKIDPPGTVNICEGQSIKLVANSGNNLTYQWKKDGENIEGAESSVWSASEPGQYKVEVTKMTTGCKKTSKATTVNITCKEDNILTTNNTSRFSLFPNPSNGKLFIEFSSDKLKDAPANIQLLNMTGQIVFEESTGIANGKLQKEIYLSSILPDGIYLLQVKVNDKIYSEKVALEK